MSVGAPARTQVAPPPSKTHFDLCKSWFGFRCHNPTVTQRTNEENRLCSGRCQASVENWTVSLCLCRKPVTASASPLCALFIPLVLIKCICLVYPTSGFPTKDPCHFSSPSTHIWKDFLHQIALTHSLSIFPYFGNQMLVQLSMGMSYLLKRIKLVLNGYNSRSKQRSFRI